MIRKFLGVLVLSLLAALPARGQVAYVSDVQSNTSFLSVATASTVVGAGSNRLLVAAVCWGFDADEETVGSVVFNTSESFTRAGGITKMAASTIMGVDLWYLVNPTVTTANTIATLAPSTGAKSMALSVIYFTGAAQTTPLGTVETGEGNVNPDGQPSETVTTTSGDIVIDALCTNDESLTSGANQTEIFDSGPGGITLQGSTQDGANGGAMTVTDVSNFFEYVYAAVNIAQFTAPAGGAVTVISQVNP